MICAPLNRWFENLLLMGLNCIDKIAILFAETIFPFEDFESLMRTNRNETISFLPNEGSESKSSMRKVV